MHWGEGGEGGRSHQSAFQPSSCFPSWHAYTHAQSHTLTVYTCMYALRLISSCIYVCSCNIHTLSYMIYMHTAFTMATSISFLEQASALTYGTHALHPAIHTPLLQPPSPYIHCRPGEGLSLAIGFVTTSYAAGICLSACQPEPGRGELTRKQ